MCKTRINGFLGLVVVTMFYANTFAQVDPVLIQRARSAGITQEQIDAAIASQNKASVTAKSPVKPVQEGETARIVESDPPPADTMPVTESVIFGREVFSSKNLTFAPNYNIPTPADYILSAGDEVIIDVWGASELNVRMAITPEGSINLSGIGPVYLNGLTISQAEQRIKLKLSNVIGGIGSRSFVKVSLGQIRSIKVNMAGEVMLPGTYTLPSLATLFNALYSAGGVNPTGSLREIKVYRNSKEVASLDVYDFLINGKYESNLRLEDNDMVIVKPYNALVAATGRIKRNRVYEMTSGETLEDLIRYAGGFTGDAYTDNLQVKRKSERMLEIFTVDKSSMSTFNLKDGDTVFVDRIIDEYLNRLVIKGAVRRPGEYQLTAETENLSGLIKKAEGLKGNEFATRGQIIRRKPDYTYEVIPFDVKSISGGGSDIKLNSNDEVIIPTIFDMREDYYVVVRGEVNKPDTLKYLDAMTVEDVILQGGGLKESASLARLELARRIKDPSSLQYSEKTAEIFTFNISQDLELKPEASRFLVKPFDEITVRVSPGYQAQESVSVEGEVLFPGRYVMATAGERLSDLVKKAGGLNPIAYVRGASLKRVFSEEEQNRIQSLLRMAKSGGDDDSISLESLSFLDAYPIGIDLEAAIAAPGGNEDVVLMPGDRLVVPKYNAVVKVSGAVLYPNAVTFENGRGLKNYLSQSGGYKTGARKRPYVVYMNGKVASTKRFLFIHGYPRIEPGCEIVVPIKASKSSSHGLAEIMGISSTSLSMASVVAMLLNALK